MKNRVDRHPMTGEIVLMTPNRLGRPNALLDHPTATGCPFCPGNEEETPPEIERISGENGWLVRVVPNKFPVASAAGGIDGAHEIIIETPNHFDELRILSPSHMRAVVDTWIRRYGSLSSLPGVRFVALFRNRGPNAGESIDHPHSQLLAVPHVPERIARHAEAADPCSLCHAVSVSGLLRIEEHGAFQLLAAPAARLPYQCWIVPRGHESVLNALGGKERDDLATILQRAESLLVEVLGTVSMNLGFVASHPHDRPFHWYVEITPRITGIAGYELLTGSTVNLVPPEEAAGRLRERR